MKRILIVPVVIFLLLAIPAPADHSGGLSGTAPDGADPGGMGPGTAGHTPDPGDPGRAPVNLSDVEKIQGEADRFGARMSRNMTAYTGELLEVMMDDRDVRIAAFTIGQAATVTAHGTTTWLELEHISKDIDGIADSSLEHQRLILWRNPVIRVLFGGDRKAAAALAQDGARYREQAGRLEDLMTALNFNQDIKPLIGRQATILREESARLVLVAERDNLDRGIFGIS